MNWTIGLLRLWVGASLAWAVWVMFFGFSVLARPEAFSRARHSWEMPSDCIYGKFNPAWCYDPIPVFEIRPWGFLDYAANILVPVALGLAAVIVALWIMKGFKKAA